MDLVSIRMRMTGQAEAVAGSKAVRAELEKLDNTQGKVTSSTAASRRGLTQWADSLKSTGSRMRSAGQSATYGLTLPIIGAGIAAAKTAIDFDKSMAQVGVALNATKPELASLRETAIDFGQKTIFSANESAEAMLELAKGGMKQAQIQGGALAATMNLAATEMLPLGESAGYVTAAMNTFDISASKSGQVANALAGASIASSANVRDLAIALQQSGQAASAAGLTLQETTGTLAAFAQNGLKGSDAGTSFKTFLQRLNPQTAKARDLMDSLGMSFFDSQGRMLSMTGIAKQLRAGFKGMTDEERGAAMTTLFGSDAYRAANIVFKEGADGLRKYIKASHDQTAAQKMANAQMKGLPGAWERLKGSVETASLALGEAMAPTLEKVADFLGKLADKFTNLPTSVQQGIAAFLGVVAAAGPLLVVLGGIAVAVGVLATPVGAVVAGITALAVAFGAAYAKSEAFREAVGSVVDSVKGFISNLISGEGETGEFGRNMVTIFGKVRDGIMWALRQAGGGLRVFWRGVKNVFGGVAQIVGGVVKIVSGILTGDWAQVWDGAKDVVAGAFRAIKGIVQQIVGVVRGVVGILSDLAKRLVGGLGDILQGIAEGIVNAMEWLLNRAIDAINLAISAYNAIPFVSDIDPIGHVGESSPTTPDVGGVGGDVPPGSGVGPHGAPGAMGGGKHHGRVAHPRAMATPDPAPAAAPATSAGNGGGYYLKPVYVGGRKIMDVVITEQELAEARL